MPPRTGNWTIPIPTTGSLSFEGRRSTIRKMFSLTMRAKVTKSLSEGSRTRQAVWAPFARTQNVR
jgi:hypothetical protein